MKIIKLTMLALALFVTQQALSVDDIFIREAEKAGAKITKYSTDNIQTVAQLKQQISNKFRVAEPQIQILSNGAPLSDTTNLTTLDPKILQTLKYKFQLVGVAGRAPSTGSKRFKPPTTSVPFKKSVVAAATIKTSPKTATTPASKKESLSDLKQLKRFYEDQIESIRNEYRDKTHDKESLATLSELEKELNNIDLRMAQSTVEEEELSLSEIIAPLQAKIINGQTLSAEEQSIFDTVQKQLEQIQKKKAALIR